MAYRRAWLSLLLYSESFVGAILVGEGLAALLGYPVGEDGTTPFWVVLAAAGPALLEQLWHAQLSELPSP